MGNKKNTTQHELL